MGEPPLVGRPLDNVSEWGKSFALHPVIGRFYLDIKGGKEFIVQ